MNNKIILHIAHYAAPYKGNFIASLENLEQTLYNNGHNLMYYIFPENVSKYEWFSEFVSKNKGRVFTVKNPHTKLYFFTDRELLKQLSSLFNTIKPDIVHSHFDGYDVYAKKVAGKQTKIIWHHHNPLTLVSNPIKRIYQRIMLQIHYGIYGKHTYTILLSDYSKKEMNECNYRGTTITIPNGIHINRIIYSPLAINPKFTFLFFGGRADHKGLDILLNAANELIENNYNFVVKITNGVDTVSILREFYGDHIPEQIKVISQTENISELYSSVNCFISASRRETFSYAIAEAMLSGLPVISSDIDGVSWCLKQRSVIPFKSEDAMDLASKMKSLICGDISISAADLAHSREHIISNYSVDHWSKKVIELYDTILN